jgi:hypothetical protein
MRMARRIICICAVAWLWSVALVPADAPPPPQLLPADEAARQPDFFSFRARLQAAIARRDVDALMAVVHPNIRNSFGPDDGIDGFREAWKPHEPDSRVWSELGEALALGGTFDAARETFSAPYVFSRWPSEYDAFEHVALIAADVRIRSAPRPDAPVISAMSFAILPTAPADVRTGPEVYTAVRLDDRKVGYIASALVRSPIDFRAIFQRQSSGWQLMSLVAGD